MNNILKDVEDLKKEIENSKEYKDYINLEKELDKNKNIKELIKKITTKQKEVVKLENIKQDSLKEEKELEELYDELNSFKLYKDYINASVKLNELITKVQNNFESYFNSLIQ